ncbi:MAG: nitroreductase family deazaflavin-dependent oxidoreductase [Acidobacteria bacterium]|nr:MAG: nitroreductase family deazaflavin-dependent oxidoreductase [Acidobacteriota bacterium]REK00574.1 MAG: nitroreductase family deazaflavin-dependent oxidoreductase [Acidobacteriota bacterium]
MSETNETGETEGTSGSGAASSGKAPPKAVLKLFTRVHVFLHRLSGGKLFNTLGGDEVCFVQMTGARSGRRLTVPLMYVPHGDALLLVASQGGAPKNPAWYHNLKAHPEIAITHRGNTRRYRARLAAAEEKPELWPVCDAHYAPYADYRKRTTRDIPIFVCEPL